MKLIGFSGKRGAGKDTLAAYLKRNSALLFGPRATVKRIGFADPMKEIIINDFNVPARIAYGDDTAKESFVPGTSVSVRKALQKLGETYNEIESGHWTRRAIKRLKELRDMFPVDTVVCVTDVRRANEIDAIRELGGKIVRLTRYARLDPHPTETALDNYSRFDLKIHNREQTLEETQAILVAALFRWGWLADQDTPPV